MSDPTTPPTTIGTDRVREAALVRPHPRQIAWQRLELCAFLHFGMNTMTDREWGDGTEDPALFDPAELDADQWMTALGAAGVGAVILTAKHHDGFCLWPTATTRHSVASSPWRGGHGDVVAEVAGAARRAGMGFGVYLSPWDRNADSYGQGRAYDDFYVAQLTELVTGYGPLFCVWLDGACGEGDDGRRQHYDVDRYEAVIRQHQPDAVMSICGPDVRWCGNEAGRARPDEWSVVPSSLLVAERRHAVAYESPVPLRSEEPDLGSREVITRLDQPLVWYPAEVNTSIRPGWFHHPVEDDQVRTGQELFDIYRGSVGGNANLLLNVPPDCRGLVAEPDVAALATLGEHVRGLRRRDLTADAELRFASGTAEVAELIDLSSEAGVWRPDRGAAAVTLDFARPTLIGAVVLREPISEGQQIERILIEATDPSGRTHRLAQAGTVGYQRIVDVEPTEVVSLTVSVSEARGPIALSGLAVLAPA